MEGSAKPFSPDNTTEIQRLELALESAGVGTWELNFNHHTFSWCRRAKMLFGFSGENIISFEQLLSLLHPDDRIKLETAFRQVREDQTENDFSLEIRALTGENGEWRWLLCKGQKHTHPANGQDRILGTFIDITHHVHARLLIAESEDRHRIFQTIVEQAPMAIGLLKGPDMVIELGNEKIFEVWGKDSSVIGMKLTDALPEIKNQVFPEILQNVYANGQPYTGTGAPANLAHNGILQEAYFDYVYTPLRNNSGAVTGIMVMATEVTEQFKTRKNLESSELKFRSLIEQAPVATCLFVGKDLIVELANQPMIGYWGKDMSVIGKPLREALPELNGQPFLEILDNILETGQTYSSLNAPVDLEVNGILSTYYFNFTYKPLFDEEGKVYGIINMSIDVTRQIRAQKALEESEAKLRSVIASAPAAMGLFVGRDLVVEMPNQAFIDIVGKGPDIAGLPLREVMPELENQPFLQILDDVYTSGIMYQSFGTQVNIVRHGVMTYNYYNITYTPILDSEGKVYAILDIAIDVTDRVLAQQQIEESQLQLLSLFEQSPVAIAIIQKEGLTFTMANPFYGELVGRLPEDIIGKSLLDALPELTGQGFDKLLTDVINTGVPFIAKEQAAEIIHEGKLQTIYVDLTYQPKKENDGIISGVLVVATDVTQQVLTRQKIQEAESTLRGAVELADLGTLQVDFPGGFITFSERLRNWYGFEKEEHITPERIYACMREADQNTVKATISSLMSPEGNGIFDVEYTIENERDNIERMLHAQGKIYYNEKGQASKIVGTVQDVTVQRKMKLALELQVQERTEELETINEELASINEEYLATNEELAEANQLLVKSNENLQQFAYVASHDLQEPLRKIQSFGNLIETRHIGELGEGAGYLKRMQASAKRMSDLIEDLLSFSRISSKKDITEAVSLSDVVATVLTDLELIVQESGAVIKVGELPVVQGDQLQLNQLFQNLISNALKFRKKDTAPLIEVTAETISNFDLPVSLKSVRVTGKYYRIDVTDNGIGFDQKYTDRIFQLFQRLHGRSEYSGTGIGLAICEKVAANHGGAISAKSQPGLGTTFSIYLPL